jgi:hypothetical protein
MKIKTSFLLLILSAVFCSSQLVAQQMSLGFVKNCMQYKRTTYTDELSKKHFSIVQDKVESPANTVLSGATLYSNFSQKNPNAGEIKILSLITDKIRVTEITFSNAYFTNYNEVFKQMVSFFNNQQSFKSTKYKTDVAKFSKDGISYYAYKNGDIPFIVISDVKLEDTYFK